MKSLLFCLVLLGILLSNQPSSGMNYAWLTNWETSETGDIIPFTGRDTIRGPVHSNDWIATQNIGGLPVFYGSVSSTMPTFRPGSPNPAGQFSDGPPRFNTTSVHIPETLEHIREVAHYQWYDMFFEYTGDEWYISIHDDQLFFYSYPEGTQRDTTGWHNFQIPLQYAPFIFFDAKIEIRGIIPANNRRVVIGCSRDIRIVDNLIIEGTDTWSGNIPAGATSAICLASERDVIIGNTWENGRENSAMGSSVVITALIFALRGSFRAEQLNDSDDPYVCDCNPDERGNIILNGGITQWRRGFVNLSNNGGTGYGKRFRYDERLRHWNTGVFEPPYLDEIQDSLIFPDTPIGTTLWDTLHIDRLGPFSGAFATQPFFTNAPYQYSGPFHIPVSFTPPNVGPYNGNLTFFLNGQYQSVALYGNGVAAGGPQIVETEIFPNPFNNTSTIRFTLPQAANVRAIVYDVLGREVAMITDTQYIAGNHQLSIGASNWSSGIYFLRFETLGQINTRKLMLIK